MSQQWPDNIQYFASISMDRQLGISNQIAVQGSLELD
jgi:hypothetical protein